ncbi:uncharacterized protein LOC114744193 [Neltuma alba]|uniref:uncharacterized protein LOC114744193 n=1 Tax=Neltuma alba TaxID=207710 RepID=UPI0010A568FC|nr:uncharacterized protein LOC114744193 [Prosopis alba]
MFYKKDNWHHLLLKGAKVDTNIKKECFLTTVVERPNVDGYKDGVRMPTNKGDNVPVEPGNVDANGGDDTEAKNVQRMKEKLSEGHGSIGEWVRRSRENERWVWANQDEREVGGNENDKEEQGNENDRDPEQEVIECVDVDGLEEIDDDGIEDLPEHWEEGGDSEDDVAREIDKGKRVLVMDEDEDKSEEGGDSEDEEGSDSEDSNYVGNSASSDTEESLVDDFEVSENSEEKDKDMGLNEDCEPPDERAICEEGCPFTLYASRDGNNVGYKVKTLCNEHRCGRVFKNPRASVKWLAEHFKEKIQERPNYSICEMKNDVERELKVHVSLHKCKRAKRRIVQHMDGSFVDEFSKLEAYCNELKVSNPGSDISVEISNEALEQGRRVFRRMYLCFNAAKVGWKVGCRPLIGVDGTFLKGKARGILLTAVGLDANDSLYPLAFALVDKENGVNCSWFIQWLRISLDLHNGSKVTFMLDMQKGLQHAVTEILPEAEHRLCARHIYANWSKRWRGNEMKKKIFSCAWSTFEEQFKDNLKALGALNKEAAEAMVSYPTSAWVRASFSNRCLSWVVDNNMSESLNAWIDEYRYLPVIRMFDGIRVKMMEKWAGSEQNVRNWKGNYSPKCLDLFEANRLLSSTCRVFFNGDEGFEVTEGQDRHTYVSLGKRARAGHGI